MATAMTTAATSLLFKQATIAGAQVPPMAIGEYLHLRNIELVCRGDRLYP